MNFVIGLKSIDALLSMFKKTFLLRSFLIEINAEKRMRKVANLGQLMRDKFCSINV